jgi:hypothetical protein
MPTVAAHRTTQPATRTNTPWPSDRPPGGENLLDAGMDRIVRGARAAVITARGDPDRDIGLSTSAVVGTVTP